MIRAQLTALSPAQRRLFTVVFIAGAATVANALYLALAAHVWGIGRDPEHLPITYQAMLVFHIVGGCVAYVAALLFFVWHVPAMFRNRRAFVRPSGLGIAALSTLLLVSGLFILSEANGRDNAGVFLAHQVAAVFVLAAYALHRSLSRDQPRLSVSLVAGGWMTIGIAAVGAAHLLEGKDVVDVRPPETPIATLLPFRALGDPAPDSPFFPSKTTTSTGDFLPTRILTHDDLPNLVAFRAETEQHGFAPNHYLGAQSCQRCHADIVEQWATSAHRFASFNNPFYRRAVELTREKVGFKRSQFCGGCHDPAIMLAGNMTAEIDPLTPESQAGLTCLACHAIDAVHDRTGNGNYNVHDQTESPYVFDRAKGGVARVVHDYVLKAKPTVHKRRMLKPFFRTAEFCLACHKVNLDVHVNDYRWLRGQNEYDAWHNSGFARNNPMTWYQPPAVKTCQDCHMASEPQALGDVSARDGRVKSHRFLAVNTALPHLRGDTATIDRIEAFLRDNKLRVDIFAVHRDDGRRLLAPDRRPVTVRAGEIVQVDVVVRNLEVGHTFPGGTNDSNEGWIAFSAGSGGRDFFRSGGLQPDGHVDPSAHFYQAVLVDRYGQRIVQRNATDIYATVYANVIRPSTSDIARYRFRVPADAGGTDLVLTAELRWRKFNRAFTEFVFEGKKVPDLPVTVIAASQVRLHVVDETADAGLRSMAAPPAVAAPGDDWKRYNDYGIGLFLDDDTRGALEMFTIVSGIEPERVDGWLNQARAFLADGSLAKAEAALRKASSVAESEPRLAFFWGQLLERSGRLTDAVEAYRATLLAYPQSRDAWSRLGRVYWLLGRVPESIDAYRQVLEIDPENAVAYHQLSLAYQSLAATASDAPTRERYAQAAREMERGFSKYKLDENAPAVTHRYRELNPHENRMSQPIVVHASSEL